MMKVARQWASATWVLSALSLSTAGMGFGEPEYEDTGNDVTVTSTPAQGQPQGLIPRQLAWPGVVVIVVIAIFVTAGVAGPVIRANLSDDEADDESGDSPG